MPTSGSATDALGALAGSSATDHKRLMPSSTMSQEDFIKLFTSQLKLQDPLKPLDNSVMLQQMSGLTQLSATQELEKTIQNLNNNMSTSQVMSASQLIGKKVQVPSQVSPLVDKEGMDGAVVLDRPASDVEIKITDPKTNKVVKTLHLGHSDKGVLDFHWDGLGDDGTAQPPGVFYKVDAAIKTPTGTIAGLTAGSFKVSSVTHDRNSGAVILNVDGLGGVKMDDLIKIQ